MNVLKMGIMFCFLLLLSASYPRADSGGAIQLTDRVMLYAESGTESDENRIRIKNFSDTDAVLLTEEGIYLQIPQNGGAILSCLSNPDPRLRLFVEGKSSGYDLHLVCGDCFIIENQEKTEFEI